MDRSTDLDSALRFVIDRIAEQAKLSGEALNDEQLLLLNYLPSSPTTYWDAEMPVLVPKNINLERVCVLAKAAYQHDHQVNPASLDWEFALAVFTLDRHPMGGLLQAAGMKPRRPLWDQLLLIVAAFVFIGATMSLVLLAGKEPWTLFKRVELGFGYLAVLLLMYSASRRIQEWQLEKDIERFRLASQFFSTAR